MAEDVSHSAKEMARRIKDVDKVPLTVRVFNQLLDHATELLSDFDGLVKRNERWTALLERTPSLQAHFTKEQGMLHDLFTHSIERALFGHGSDEVGNRDSRVLETRIPETVGEFVERLDLEYDQITEGIDAIARDDRAFKELARDLYTQLLGELNGRAAQLIGETRAKVMGR